MSRGARSVEVSERLEVPWLSIVLGYGPMLPLVAGAAASWLIRGSWQGEIVRVTMI